MNITRNRTLLGLGVAALSVLLMAGSCDEPVPDNAQAQGQKQTETAFKQQSDAVPYPAGQLRDSLERRNIRERLLRTNKPNSIGYVYLMSFGKIIGYYVVKGKVTSTQSQMTTSELVNYACDDGLQGCQATTVPAPGDDGSYGDNEPGIFFFTQSNQMVTTSLDYIWSDSPLPIDVPRFA